jgi:hypothetical protein
VVRVGQNHNVILVQAPGRAGKGFLIANGNGSVSRQFAPHIVVQMLEAGQAGLGTGQRRGLAVAKVLVLIDEKLPTEVFQANRLRVVESEGLAA